MSPHGLGKRGKEWASYEEVATFLLRQIGHHFHLAEVEGKQKVRGVRSGATWEIDAKGVRDDGDLFVIVECVDTRSLCTKEAVAAVAYRIQDTGADGARTVSPLRLQKGAAKVAASKTEHVKLRADSTQEEWFAEIGKLIYFGVTETVRIKGPFGF